MKEVTVDSELLVNQYVNGRFLQFFVVAPEKLSHVFIIAVCSSVAPDFFARQMDHGMFIFNWLF